jgi:hypothetical protein
LPAGAEGATIAAMRSRRVGAAGALAVAAVAMLSASCGGGGGGGTQDWASGVCRELDAWVSRLQDAASGVVAQGLNADQEQLRLAVDEAGSATADLVAGLDGLDGPDSESIAAASEQLDALGTRLEQRVADVREALGQGGGALALVAAVSTKISEAAGDVQATLQRIERLEPGGELADAFAASDECEALRQRELPA